MGVFQRGHVRCNLVLMRIFLMTMAIGSFLFTGCEQEDFSPVGKRYVLHRGSNYSSPLVASGFEGKELIFKARFDDSARYTIDEPFPIPVNKLYGFSDCSSPHHENSARFGWKWEALARGGEPVLQIFAYTYVNKDRIYDYITSVPLNRDVSYAIRAEDGEYLFEMITDAGIVQKRMKRGCSGYGGPKYMDGPYFGGEKPAPQKITIWITD